MKPTFTHWLRTGYALRINLCTGFLLVAHYSKKSSLQTNSFLELNRQPVTHTQHGIIQSSAPTQIRTGYAPVSHCVPFSHWLRTGFHPSRFCELANKQCECIMALRTGYALLRQHAHRFRTKVADQFLRSRIFFYALVLRTGTSAKNRTVVGNKSSRTGYALVRVRVCFI